MADSTVDHHPMSDTRSRQRRVPLATVSVSCVGRRQRPQTVAPIEALSAGKKSAGVVKRFGVRLVPRLYAHLNPMTYQEAVEAEPRLAEELRARGYQVFGGH